MGRAIVQGIASTLFITVVLVLPGCRDFKVGDGRQQDHALLTLPQVKGPARRGPELGSLGDGALSSRSVNAELIVQTADQGPPSQQQITVTGADSIPAMASWAGLSVEGFLRKNPSLRTRALVVDEALFLNLTRGEASRFHGLRKVAVARWQMQRESGGGEPLMILDHVIVAGEGITSLLARYRTTEDLLIQENGAVRMGSLRPGQTVKVPIVGDRPAGPQG